MHSDAHFQGGFHENETSFVPGRRGGCFRRASDRVPEHAGRGQRRGERHRWRRHRPERSRGRGLGDRRDERPSDEIRQGRRHRRSRAFPHTRSSQGQLQRVGARLRAGRLAQGEQHAGKYPSPDRSARAQRSRGGGILSRHVLVFDDQHPGQERISRHRRKGQRHLVEHQVAGAVGRHRQERMPVVPLARLEGHAHGAEGIRPRRRGLGASHAIRTGLDANGARTRLHGCRRSA